MPSPNHTRCDGDRSRFITVPLGDTNYPPSKEELHNFLADIACGSSLSRDQPQPPQLDDEELCVLEDRAEFSFGDSIETGAAIDLRDFVGEVFV